MDNKETDKSQMNGSMKDMNQFKIAIFIEILLLQPSSLQDLPSYE